MVFLRRINRRTYNKKLKPACKYQEGDLVAIKRTLFATGAKVQPKYYGPYRVVRATGPDRYEVVRTGGSGPDHERVKRSDTEFDLLL